MNASAASGNLRLVSMSHAVEVIRRTHASSICADCSLT